MTKVVLHEELTNFRKLMIIQMKNPVKEEARLAVQGEYYKTGERLAKRRVKA